jgi:hypothetical protein
MTKKIDVRAHPVRVALYPVHECTLLKNVNEKTPSLEGEEKSG